MALKFVANYVVFRSTCLFFLTARDTEIDRVVGLEIGADEYVVKPFSPREIAARVRAIFKKNKLTPLKKQNPSNNRG